MPKSATEQFDPLVAPHLGVLFRVAYRLLRNTADAQDLVQDTCIAACENLADLATDELVELAIEGIDEARAAALIMAARNT